MIGSNASAASGSNPDLLSPVRLLLCLVAPLAVATATIALLPLVTTETPPLALRLSTALLSGGATCALLFWWMLASLSSTRKGQASAQEQTETLDRDNQRLHSIISSIPEAVLVVDQAGKATVVNPQWEDLFGIPESMGGTPSIAPEQQAHVAQLVRRTLDTGTSGKEELNVIHPEPKTIIAASSTLDDGSGAVIVARDISEFLRLAEIRRDFVANVSHELKTPLSAIRGLAETLQDGALDDSEVAQPFVGRILSQCGRLEALLADLLTLSRLEHPLAGIELRSIDLATVLREAVEMLGARAKNRSIDIGLEIPPVCVINGDPDALDRLVLNLLENAIKYNQAGGRVDARLAQRGNEVVLEVTDTGIGIPANSIDRLFERFYRVDKGRSRAEGGTGLGLAIVKHAAILHGGRIEVESQLGQGSTFRVHLPCEC